MTKKSPPLQSAKLFISDIDKARGLSKIFLPSPTEEEFEILGQFFAVMEIEALTDVNLRLASIFEEIQQNYYQEELLADSDFSLENHLENILKEANQKIYRTLQTGSVNFDLNKLNFLIGVIKDEELFFCQQGKIKPLLIYEINKDAPATKHKNIAVKKIAKKIEANYNVLDVLKNTDDTTEKPTLNKIFSNIISGSLSKSDTLIICNENFTDFLSLEKIKKTLITIPLKGGIELLKNLLTESPSHLTFLALIFQNKSKEIEVGLSEKISSEQSVNTFLTTQQKTSKILSPSILPSLKRLFISLTESINKLFSRKDKSVTAENVPLPVPPAKNLILKKHSLIKKLFGGLGTILKLVFSLPSKPKKYGEKIKLKSKEKYIGSKNWLAALKKSSKTILSLIVVVILVFIVSLYFVKQKQINRENEITYNAKIEEIRQKQNNLESSLIYGDEEKVKNLIAEIKAILTQLPQDSLERKENYKSIADQIDEQSKKLQRLTKIGQVPLIVDFETIAPAIKLERINFDDNKIYAYGPKQNIIYEYDLNTSKIKQFEVTQLGENKLEKMVPTPNNTFYVYLSNNQLARFTPAENKLKVVDFTPAESEVLIQDVQIYNENIYLLSPEKNQIYKHLPIENGYSKGQSWVKDQTNLQSTVSLAIDGSIYVLKSTGEIIKFRLGAKQNYSLSLLDPSLVSPTKIYTNAESAYIYVLDPPTKRLIAWEKQENEAKLVAQYTSDNFNDLKDFYVFEKEKKIYLLNGQSIYAIPATHLK